MVGKLELSSGPERNLDLRFDQIEIQIGIVGLVQTVVERLEQIVVELEQVAVVKTDRIVVSRLVDLLECKLKKVKLICRYWCWLIKNITEQYFTNS